MGTERQRHRALLSFSQPGRPRRPFVARRGRATWLRLPAACRALALPGSAGSDSAALSAWLGTVARRLAPPSTAPTLAQAG